MRVCIRNGIDIQCERLDGWLDPKKAYIVLSVEQYSSDEIGLRIESDESGQPVLFKASLFDVVDGALPTCWKVLSLREGSMVLGPEVFGQAGFWERCFDRDPLALDEYRRAKAEVVADS